MEVGTSNRAERQEVVGTPIRIEMDVTQPGFDCNMPHTSTIRHDIVEKPQSRKLVPISQWGIKFSGNDSMSINAFLERIDELKDARNATDEDLWRYAIDLFEKDALIWFRANRSYVTNWAELVFMLQRNFQRPYYQEELLDEIRRRTQGSDESVTIFISIMQNMFNRLQSPVSESYKVNIILKNLQPYYQRAVCRDEFSSIMDLVNVLRIVERTKLNCDAFEKPSVGKRSLEPDLAYKGSEVNTVTVDSSPKEEIGVIERNVDGNTRRCWNCREYGHAFRNCTLPKQRLFCYRCGRFGTISKDCSCQGNYKGGNNGNAKELFPPTTKKNGVHGYKFDKKLFSNRANSAIGCK